LNFHGFLIDPIGIESPLEAAWLMGIFEKLLFFVKGSSLDILICEFVKFTLSLVVTAAVAAPEIPPLV
jgi:hypothetical protein